MTKKFLNGRYELGQVITAGIPPHTFPVIVVGDHVDERGFEWLVVQSEEPLDPAEDEPEDYGIAAGEAWVMATHYVHADTYPPADLATRKKGTPEGE